MYVQLDWPTKASISLKQLSRPILSYLSIVEGKVNKLKVIKRIMYGRCGFNTFKNKVIGLEKIG